jgi:hypothetical protein
MQEPSELREHPNQVTPNHRWKRVSRSHRGVVVLQSAIHVFARRRPQTLISPRCAPLSVHASLLSRLSDLSLSKQLILPIDTSSSAPDHRFRERSTPLPHYFRPDHPLSCTAVTADTTSADSSTSSTAYSTLSAPNSTATHYPAYHTIHAALAAKTSPLQAFCIPPRPPPTTLSISRHPGSQSAHLTPSCNPHLATVSCCVVHDHATLTSAARLPAYPAAHLAQ